MPPTQQASKVNDHMMFTPHQNPFIDLLLTTITVIHAVYKKRQQEALYLGADGGLQLENWVFSLQYSLTKL